MHIKAERLLGLATLEFALWIEFMRYRIVAQRSGQSKHGPYQLVCVYI